MIGALAPVLVAALAAAPTCPPDSELAYVCGAERPEDVLAIPGTPWLIASGFAPGAGLKLVDTRNRSLTRWFTGAPDQIAPDPSCCSPAEAGAQSGSPPSRGHEGADGCPGPVDPALFNARGLSLRATGKGWWQLLVVNHGGRESIERFDVATDGPRPTLRWRGCLVMPAGQVGNSVASFVDGTILVTVLTRPGTTIGDFMLGRATGGVWQHRPGTAGFTLLPGTELPGNNGLEVDPDERHFYVVAFGWHAVVVFDHADTRRPLARIDAPDFLPDNIHWSGGRLLLAGMRLDEPACGGVRKVVDGVADPMLCHRGWVVGALDMARRRIGTVAYGRPQPAFNGLSAAAIVGDDLWLGSFQSSRLAVIRNPEGTP